MSVQPALVTPMVVKWARERAMLSHAFIAEKLRTKSNRVASWESEDETSRPTFRQAQQLARTLRIPFGYIFLPEPPKHTTPLADFRTVGSRGVKGLSPDLRDVLNSAMIKQNWYHHFLQEEQALPVSLAGRFRTSADPKSVAKAIRDELQIDGKLLKESTGWQDFLLKLSARAEQIGVVVMRTGVVNGNNRRPLSVQEFRGFALYDNLAPLVFVNGKDVKAAQIFTLVHELAHISVASTSLSNRYLGSTVTADRNTETFCNSVAAEALVPSASVKSLWNSNISVEQNIRHINREHRVSYLVALRRAFDCAKIDQDLFAQLYLKDEKREKEREKKAGGGSYYNNVQARNGKTLTINVVGAACNGRLSYRDAARFLAVPASKIPTIAGRLGING